MKKENRGGVTTSQFTHYRCKCGNVFEEKFGKYGCCDYPAKPILKKWGGVRIAGEGKKIGAPKKNPTKVLNFRIPVKDYDRLKVLLGEYLASLLK